jgi:hypothetical protein
MRREAAWRLLAVFLLAIGALAAGVVVRRAPAARVREQSAPTDRAGAPEERLRALPYAAWAPTEAATRGMSGVIRHLRGRASPGLNLYALPTRGEAQLFDMDGRLVHAWASSVGQPDPSLGLLSFFGGWQHVALGPAEELYAIVSRSSLLKLDAASRILWERRLAVHHDLWVTPDGDVFVPTDELRVVERPGRRRLVIDNVVVRLSQDGAVRGRWSVLEVLRREPAFAKRFDSLLDGAYAALDAGLRDLLEARRRDGGEEAEHAHRLLAHPRLVDVERALAGQIPPGPDAELLSLLREVPGSPPDLLHTNAVLVLDRDVRGLGRQGDFLVSVRNLDLLAVVDPEAGRLRWSWGPGQLERQHQPSVLANGHLLVFDNRPRRGRSRVLELAPDSGEIVWSYEGTGAGFFSEGMGGCQGLANGNVLVVESAAGRAFEVTRSGEVVWEFLAPELPDGRRTTLYRMERIELVSSTRKPGLAPRAPGSESRTARGRR